MYLQISMQLSKKSVPRSCRAAPFYGERAGDHPQHHRDPFDGMLVAQSQAEGLEIITADDTIRQYAVKTLSALR